MSLSRYVGSRRGLQAAWRVWVVLASAIAVTNSIQAAELAAQTMTASAAVASSPTPAETQFAEGLRLAGASELAAAIDVFARLTHEYPQLPQPFAQLAALYMRQG
ncbi:MAG: hypothetical protein ABW110_08205, partial [Steroidobacteraceae bacterium]